MTDLVERVARAICYNRAAPACDCRAKGSTCRALVENLMWESNEISSQARAAVRIALEEAAKVSRPPSHMLGSADPYANGYRAACADIAAAIRGMIKGNDVQQA